MAIRIWSEETIYKTWELLKEKIHKIMGASP
jgi:hypothetical protein